MVEGRLEMCVDGVWGIALLSYRISIKTANVACRQLGFSAKGFIFCHNAWLFILTVIIIHTASRVLSYSPYGDGDSPVVYSEVNCHGNEKSLFDCRLSPASSAYCISHYRHIHTLSIRCTDGEN